MKVSALLGLCIAALTAATPYSPSPFSNLLQKRQNSDRTNSSDPLIVDLGYATYAGTANETIDVNSWKGIRYAAPPTSTLRWQAPQTPTTESENVIQATKIPHQCPQHKDNTGVPTAALENLEQDPGSEDCLFLSVFAPANASNLPVLVWIHGGGYGAGNGSQDLTAIISQNNGSFIGVSIQYRLGAFGFLASDEVGRYGTLNAGLRDQEFALEWVQSYIRLFGGDPDKVTIAGNSAGAGSVMMMAMAYGGTLGNSLFRNAIVSSPYLPMQYHYKDFVPSQSYYAFAQAAGCLSGYAAGSPAVSKSIFECLVGTDTNTLMNASASTVASGMYGTWGGFTPVTDDVFIQQRPTTQLQKKQVNGEKILSGNNALEGPSFVPQNITTEDGLVSWLEDTFPLFSEDDISKILRYYPGSNTTDPMSAIEYATLGYTGPTANNQSSLAVGNQARANNIYAETTFVCPSYWLAEAYTNKGREAWKYQYSTLPALHGMDIGAFLGPAGPSQGPEFTKALMSIWGNFVTKGNPSIGQSIAEGSLSSNTSSSTSASSSNPITSWPAYTNARPYQINLNETGVVAVSAVGVESYGSPVNVTELHDPGLRNEFTLVDAWEWEGGRGVRCDFWKSVGEIVPE